MAACVSILRLHFMQHHAQSSSYTELCSFIFRSVAVSLHVLLFPLVGWDKLLLSMRTEGGGAKRNTLDIRWSICCFQIYYNSGILCVLAARIWFKSEVTFAAQERGWAPAIRWREAGGWTGVKISPPLSRGESSGPQLTIQDPLNTSDWSREQLHAQIIDLLDHASAC